MTTYCLGTFAMRLSRLPRDHGQWKALIESQPEVCERGCKSYHGKPYACRSVCREYANAQWQLSRNKA